MRTKAIINVIAQAVSHMIYCKDCPLNCKFMGYEKCRKELSKYFTQLVSDFKERNGGRYDIE